MSEVHFSADKMVAVDATASAASYVAREYGYGYRIGLAYGGFRIGVFEVAASDGSRFNIVADRWGNVERIPDDASREVAHRIVKAFSEASAVV